MSEKNCCLCLDSFSESQTVSSLSCGDYLCSTCLKSMKYLSSLQKFSEMPCPKCQRDIFSDLCHFDWTELSENEVKLCENCEIQSSKVYCENCNIYFCENCDQTLHSGKAMQKHSRSRYLPGSTISEPWGIILKQSNSKELSCNQHPDYFLNRFCLKCQVRVCSECAKISHTNHEIEEITETLSKFRVILHQSIVELTQLYHKIMTTVSFSHSNEHLTIHAILQQFQLHFNSLYSLLESRRLELLSQAHSLALSRYSHLLSQQQILSKIHTNSVQTLHQTHQYLQTLHQQKSSNGDSNESEYQRVLQGLQSILDVDVMEHISGIYESEMTFQYSSSLPEMLYSYGEIGTGNEPWHRREYDDFDLFLTPKKSPEISKNEKIELSHERRSTLYGLIDQVVSIVNQTNTMNRHIDILRKGIGIDGSGTGTGISKTDSMGSETFPLSFQIPTQKTCLNQRNLFSTDRFSSSSSSLTQSKPISPISAKDFKRSGSSGEISIEYTSSFLPSTLPIDPDSNELASPRTPTMSPTGTPLKGQIHSTISPSKSQPSEMSALESTRHDINTHFELLYRILLCRYDFLHDQLLIYLQEKEEYLTQQLPHVLGFKDSLYRHLLQSILSLQSSDDQLISSISAARTLQEQSATFLSPSVYSTYSFYLVQQQIPPMRIPYDISPFLEQHGTVGGPPAPIDLQLARTHHGHGTSVELSWKDGPLNTSTNSHTIDYFLIQSAVYTPQESEETPRPLQTQFTLSQPFTDITQVSSDIFSCVIDIRDFPNSLLFFRLKAVNLNGISGPWSSCVTIQTPSSFSPLFEYLPGQSFTPNGLFYWLGTKQGTQPYQNPLFLKEISVSSSTIQGTLSLCVSHTAETGVCMSHNKIQSWIMIDLGPGRYLQPHGYCLRSGKGENYKLRQWELHGKIDKNEKKWHVLKKHKNCQDLKESSYSTASWDIVDTFPTFSSPPPLDSTPLSPSLPLSPSSASPTPSCPCSPRIPIGYRYFRLIQTGMNSSGDHHLVCHGIDFYGILHEKPPVKYEE